MHCLRIISDIGKIHFIRLKFYFLSDTIIFLYLRGLSGGYKLLAINILSFCAFQTYEIQGLTSFFLVHTYILNPCTIQSLMVEVLITI